MTGQTVLAGPALSGFDLLADMYRGSKATHGHPRGPMTFEHNSEFVAVQALIVLGYVERVGDSFCLTAKGEVEVCNGRAGPVS